MTILLFVGLPQFSWSQLSQYPNRIQEKNESNIISYLIDTIQVFDPILKKEVIEVRKLPVYTEVDEMPVFGHCIDSNKEKQAACSADQLDFYFYISCINYRDVNKQIIEGTVICSFIVTSYGFVLYPKIVKSLSVAADAKVLNMLDGMPNWVSGKKDGENVNVQFTLPVTFRQIE